MMAAAGCSLLTTICRHSIAMLSRVILLHRPPPPHSTSKSNQTPSSAPLALPTHALPICQLSHPEHPAPPCPPIPSIPSISAPFQPLLLPPSPSSPTRCARGCPSMTGRWPSEHACAPAAAEPAQVIALSPAEDAMARVSFAMKGSMRVTVALHVSSRGRWCLRPWFNCHDIKISCILCVALLLSPRTTHNLTPPPIPPLNAGEGIHLLRARACGYRRPSETG